MKPGIGNVMGKCKRFLTCKWSRRGSVVHRDRPIPTVSSGKGKLSRKGVLYEMGYRGKKFQDWAWTRCFEKGTNTPLEEGGNENRKGELF